MSEIQELLQRQAAWQKRLAGLSWPEKIRMAEAVRPSVLQLVRSGRRVTPGGSAPTPTPPEGKPPRSLDP